MQFKDIIGQNSIKQRFTQIVLEDRIPHAQLLAGPAGNGKLALAVAFAQYVNCNNRLASDSCGECASCRKYSKLIHPDLHFIVPVAKSDKFKDATTDDYIAKWRTFFINNPYPQFEKWMELIAEENKQGSIFVHEAAALLNKLNKKSYEAEYKIVIVWMPERMNDECANKILKILEEPPEKTLFLLVTESEERLLSTIRSRCQFVRIPKIDVKDMEIALARHPLIGNLNAATVARLARGNYLKAFEMMQEDETRTYYHQQFSRLMRAGYGRKLDELLGWSDDIAAIGRVKQMGFLKYCGEAIRENFITNLKEPNLNFMDEKESAFSQKFSPFVNENNVMQLFKEFEKANRDVAANGNAKLLLTDLSIKISKLIRL